MLQKNNGYGFALVELFTSEGCSSCPPADEAVAQLVKSGQKNVYVLSFHVDYWNSLGWKDVFSSAAYSARQQAYGDAFRLNSVYTPQAVVNGTTQFTGSDTKRLNSVVDAALAQEPGDPLQVWAKMGAGQTVSIVCKMGMPANHNTINIALVQLNAQSNVLRGENAGMALHHVNVVRDFKTISTGQAAAVITLALPPGVAANNCKIVAFAQNGNLKVTAVEEAAIQ